MSSELADIRGSSMKAASTACWMVTRSVMSSMNCVCRSAFGTATSSAVADSISDSASSRSLCGESDELAISVRVFTKVAEFSRLSDATDESDTEALKFPDCWIESDAVAGSLIKRAYTAVTETESDAVEDSVRTAPVLAASVADAGSVRLAETTVLFVAASDALACSVADLAQTAVVEALSDAVALSARLTELLSPVVELSVAVAGSARLLLALI